MKKLLSLVAAIVIAATSFAQVDEVTLTTIGTGQNEDEATLRALRNAMEQTFGTFVSANTTIVNDQLVKDEIAATSKGNVKEFTKLAVVKLPNNTTSVTLKATISVNKLITYARKNGSQAEFAGQTYAMNLKLRKLQQKNANKTLDVLQNNVTALCKHVFDYDIKLGEPSVESVYIIPHDSLYKEDKFSHNLGWSYTYGNGKRKDWAKKQSIYVLPFTLNVYSTDVTTNIYTMVTQTLDALQLSPTEESDFKKDGLACCHWGKWTLPVSYDKMHSISSRISSRICDDFFKLQMRKINDTETYTFQTVNQSTSIDLCLRNATSGLMDCVYTKWLLSSKRKIAITTYSSSAGEPGLAYNGIPYVSHRSEIIAINNHRKEVFFDYNLLREEYFSKWNTKKGNKIQQSILSSFPLMIILTEAELERFNGLEIIGAASPKYTTPVTISTNSESKQVRTSKKKSK